MPHLSTAANVSKAAQPAFSHAHSAQLKQGHGLAGHALAAGFSMQARCHPIMTAGTQMRAVMAGRLACSHTPKTEKTQLSRLCDGQWLPTQVIMCLSVIWRRRQRRPAAASVPRPRAPAAPHDAPAAASAAPQHESPQANFDKQPDWVHSERSQQASRLSGNQSGSNAANMLNS